MNQTDFAFLLLLDLNAGNVSALQEKKTPVCELNKVWVGD